MESSSFSCLYFSSLCSIVRVYVNNEQGANHHPNHLWFNWMINIDLRFYLFKTSFGSIGCYFVWFYWQCSLDVNHDLSIRLTHTHKYKLIKIKLDLPLDLTLPLQQFTSLYCIFSLCVAFELSKCAHAFSFFVSLWRDVSFLILSSHFL